MSTSSPPDDLAPENRRREPRPRTIKSGKLFFGGFQKTVFDCLVLDLSDTGVRIETAVMIDAPETAFLQIQDDMIGPMTRRWTAGNQIGFEFTPKK